MAFSAPPCRDNHNTLRSTMQIDQLVRFQTRAGCWFPRITFVFGLLCALETNGQPIPPAALLPTLTQIEQVRRLTPEQARQGYPLHLKAVVTYFDGVSSE